MMTDLLADTLVVTKLCIRCHNVFVGKIYKDIDDWVRALCFNTIFVSYSDVVCSLLLVCFVLVSWM